MNGWAWFVRGGDVDEMGGEWGGDIKGEGREWEKGRDILIFYI